MQKGATEYQGTTIGTTNLTFCSILLHYFALPKNTKPLYIKGLREI